VVVPSEPSSVPEARSVDVEAEEEEEEAEEADDDAEVEEDDDDAEEVVAAFSEAVGRMRLSLDMPCLRTKFSSSYSQKEERHRAGVKANNSNVNDLRAENTLVNHI